MPDLHTDELVTLGRDRDAVLTALAALDGVQQLDQIAPLLGGIVANIGDDDLGRPTPCANFAVADVLEHMIGGASAFASAFRGDGSPAQPPTDGDVFARWNAAMGALMEAVHTDGAQDNTISSPFGEVSGAYFARYVALDGITHAWDLATATGQHFDPPAELVGQVDAFARELLVPEMRDGDTFAAATEPSADATPIERLVAFTGRTVTR